MEPQDRTGVIRKVRSLIASAADKSISEAEAVLFADKAHEWVAFYNLSPADIAEPLAAGAVTERVLWTDRAAWTYPLLYSAARLYFCGYFFQSVQKDIPSAEVKKTARRVMAGGRGTAFLKHTFVGFPHNLEVALPMTEYLLGAAERMLKEDLTKQKDSIDPKDRASYTVSFLNQCSVRLSERLDQRRSEAMDKELETEDGTTLPKLQSLYETAETAVLEYIERVGVVPIATKARTRILSRRGANAGEAAGADISLNGQTTKPNKKTNLRLVQNDTEDEDDKE